MTFAHVQWAHPIPIPRALGASVSNGAQDLPALLSAVEWLAVCILCALIYWGFVRRVYRRRRHRRPMNRGALFLAFFLVAFAGGNLVIADMFAPREPLFFLPIAGFFLLFFYLFSDARYTPVWARWLVLLYGISQIGALIPSSQNQNQNSAQFDQFVAHIPSAILTLGHDVAMVVGNILFVTIVVLGIVPQVYFRYRRLNEKGALYQIPRNTKVVLGVTAAIGSFLVLLAALLFAQSSPQNPSLVFLCVRTGFFLLTTLVPIAGGFALLRGRLYDRDALANRALIYGALIICLLFVYIVAVELRFFIPVLLAGPLILLFIAIVTPIMVALFPPVLAQAQERIDRRFFRRRYDAARTLAGYRVTLREQTHLDQLSACLVSAVEKSMESSFVTLWLRTPVALLTPYGAGIVSLPVSAGAGSERARVSERPPELRLRRQIGTGAPQLAAPALAIVPDDPARATLLRSSDAVETARLPEDSLVARELREDGTTLALPLLWQGELVGLVALGARLGAQPYTFDDRELLTALMDEVTPPLHLAHVAHEQDVELRQRERVEQELQTARRIQEALLPKTVPSLAGWQIATLYQPAREVGGDFYDFFTLAEGRLGLVLGDVTDKGIPAALVMATTRSMLRAVAAHQSISPGEVLAQVNELLCPDLPASMFVTCFYAILDPDTGHLRFANAGQDLPYLRHPDGSICELHATGMPLGMMPERQYEEGEATLAQGDSLLFYSDGLVEAHNPQREMFGLPRLTELLRTHSDGTPPIVYLLHELTEFTGEGWEQEDDITLVTVQRLESGDPSGESTGSSSAHAADNASGGGDLGNTEDTAAGWRTLDEWTVASEPGNERHAIARMAQAVHDLPLAPERLERLKTAVGEATMNAMEHGNGYVAERPVALVVRARSDAVSVLITDAGGQGQDGQGAIPSAPEPPDLDAKLAGVQSPRGWGLFLIKELVDELYVTGDATHHTVELRMALDGATHE